MIYAKSDLTDIRAKIDILTYLEKRGMTFRQTGMSWVALCPIHNERSPSFHVKPESQTFHCFGCGASGDIFSLVMALDTLSFPGAVQELAEETGIELKIDEDPQYKQRQRLLQITSLSSQWYRRNYIQLPIEHPAKEDLSLRNLYEHSITDSTIGFAAASGLLQVLTSRGFTNDEIVAAGMAYVSDKDNSLRERFRNRLIWTITDVQGKPIGFSARRIFDTDTGPKFLNSPQTDLYNKSKALMGLSDAKKTIVQEQLVYVVEGNADVTAMKAAGILNTVASCGTAFGIEQANMLLHLSKLGRDSEKFKIIFCFDGDVAGLKAARAVFESNKQIHLNSYVVKLANPDQTATDPCDYRKDFGDAALQDLVSKDQSNIVEFILVEELKKVDIKTPEGQSAFINKAREILSLVTDPIQHSSYSRKVAFWTGISYSEISTMLRPQHRPSRIQQEARDASNVAPTQGNAFENKLMAALVQYPQDSLALLEKYHMDETFFNTRTELVLQVIEQAKSKEGFDFSNPEFSILSHLDLMIIEARKEYGLELLFKSYLKHLHAMEIVKLNARMASVSGSSNDSAGDAALFEEMIEEQNRLKIKYNA